MLTELVKMSASVTRASEDVVLDEHRLLRTTSAVRDGQVPRVSASVTRASEDVMLDEHRLLRTTSAVRDGQVPRVDDNDVGSEGTFCRELTLVTTCNHCVF